MKKVSNNNIFYIETNFNETVWIVYKILSTKLWLKTPENGKSILMDIKYNSIHEIVSAIVQSCKFT